MRYSILCGLIGCALIAAGSLGNRWMLPAAWLGVDFLLMGVAHACGYHRILGKRPDGRMALWGRVLFFPLLALTSVVWHLLRLLLRDPPTNVVDGQLVIGRRLLASEVPGEFENFVDLTAEFAEPAALRRSPAYLSFAILDGSAPTSGALQQVVAALRPGRTFVHCAQGYGRTALFALAILITRGVVGNVEDGLRLLQAARPGMRLGSDQLRCIRRFAEDISRV